MDRGHVFSPLQNDPESVMALSILIVDDHPVVRHGLRALLEVEQGWEVIDEAADGLEALEKAGRFRPDVILLDVSMPKLNGLDACRLIRKAIPASEILIVTQHDSAQMMREALDAGARGYMVKSNAGRDLLAAVKAVSQHKPFTLRDAVSPGDGRSSKSQA